MGAGLPLVSLLALPRKARAAAGASGASHLREVAVKVSAGCASCCGQRMVASARKQEDSQRLSKRLSLSIETLSFESVFIKRKGLALSERSSVVRPFVQLAHPALVCFVIQIQSKAASPRARPNPSFKRTRLRQAA